MGLFSIERITNLLLRLAKTPLLPTPNSANYCFPPKTHFVYLRSSRLFSQAATCSLRTTCIAPSKFDCSQLLVQYVSSPEGILRIWSWTWKWSRFVAALGNIWRPVWFHYSPGLEERRTKISRCGVQPWSFLIVRHCFYFDQLKERGRACMRLYSVRLDIKGRNPAICAHFS
jgi:hypothetical protein